MDKKVHIPTIGNKDGPRQKALNAVKKSERCLREIPLRSPWSRFACSRRTTCASSLESGSHTCIPLQTDIKQPNEAAWSPNCSYFYTYSQGIQSYQGTDEAA